jgi:TonB family protein
MSHDSKLEITTTEIKSKKYQGGKQVLIFEWWNGSEKQTRYLHKKRVVLGSVVSADVCLSGNGISPIHAVIELEVDPVSGKDHGVLYDLASTTGTWVSGEKVVTKALKSGDTIRIGDVELRFDLRDVDSVSLNHPFHEMEGRKLFIDRPEVMGALLLVNEHEVEEIFDYKSTQKQAVEIIFSWMDTVLDTQHFVDQKKVTIGSAIENDFGVPGLKIDPFVLIEHPGDDFILNVPPDMEGIIQRQGSIQSIENVGKTITLKPNDLVKLKLGDLRIYVNPTSAPPTLKRRRLLDRDPLFFRILFISLLVTFSILFTLFRIQPDPTLEVEQVPERVATILYQPEKFMVRRLPTPLEKVSVEPEKLPESKKVVKVEIKPSEKPLKTVPKEMNVGEKKQVSKAKARPAQNEAKEGEGARAKAKEGRRGTRTAKASKEAQNKAMRPSPSGGTGQGGAASEVADQGNVNLLKGAVSQIENVLGASAESLGKSGSSLKGFGGFDTLGSGGLALSGTGSGGGGDAEGLGGLGKKGRGGGRVGTGLGAAGSGTGIVGGKTRVELRRGGPEETIVMGSIDPSLIEAAIMAHRDEFRLCYEREINAENPNQSGRVGTSFVIGASGRVTQAGVVSSTLNNPNTERCILQVLKRIQFPIPRGAGIIEVKYPFKFSSG